MITFTNTNRYFHHHVNLDRLQKYFYVVLEPSWAGYAIPEILLWMRSPNPVIVQSTEITDRRFLNQLNSNLIPVPFGASDWVDHRIFRPLGLQKEYDAVYVANYTPGKRLHVYFRALKELKRRGIVVRAAAVCARHGGRRATVLKLIQYYGLSGSLDLIEGASREEVNVVLNKSKCNVLLSLKEGSNRSVFESIFADTPVIVLRDNVGVNKAYINHRTGMLTTDADLPDALVKMMNEYQHFDPRGWAMQEIAPEITTKKLAHALSMSHGLSLNMLGNLMVKVNTPEARYFDHSLRVEARKMSQRVLETFSAPGAAEESNPTTLRSLGLDSLNPQIVE